MQEAIKRLRALAARLAKAIRLLNDKIESQNIDKASIGEEMFALYMVKDCMFALLDEIEKDMIDQTDNDKIPISEPEGEVNDGT